MDCSYVYAKTWNYTSDEVKVSITRETSGNCSIGDKDKILKEERDGIFKVNWYFNCNCWICFKIDSILIIVAAAIVTALVGGLGPIRLFETLGTSFVANRSMAIFILVMLVTGTLERNGLKNAAAALIGKVKNASPGVVIGAYGIMRSIFAAFNVSFGGVAGFVRPSLCRWQQVQLKQRRDTE